MFFVEDFKNQILNMELDEVRIFYMLPMVAGFSMSPKILNGTFGDDEIYPETFIPYYIGVKREKVLTDNEKYFYYTNGLVMKDFSEIIKEDEIIQRVVNYSTDIPFRKLSDLTEISGGKMYFDSFNEVWNVYRKFLTKQEEMLSVTKVSFSLMNELMESLEETQPELLI